MKRDFASILISKGCPADKAILLQYNFDVLSKKVEKNKRVTLEGIELCKKASSLGLESFAKSQIKKTYEAHNNVMCRYHILYNYVDYLCGNSKALYRLYYNFIKKGYNIEDAIEKDAFSCLCKHLNGSILTDSRLTYKNCEFGYYKEKLINNSYLNLFTWLHVQGWEKSRRDDLAILNFIMDDVCYAYFDMNEYFHENEEWWMCNNAARNLYYYNACRDFLEISDKTKVYDFKDKIESRSDLCEFDYYYLALLTDSIGDKTPIEQFEKSKNVYWSQKCLESINLCGTSRLDFLRQICPKKKNVSFEQDMFEYISEYMHSVEISHFVDDEFIPSYNFYNTFRFDLKIFGNNGILRQKLNEIETDVLIYKLGVYIKDEEEKANELRKKELKEIEHLLLDCNVEVGDEYELVNRHVENNNDDRNSCANIIALRIQKYTIKENYYLMIIWAYFLSGRITFDDVEDLCFYLTYVSLSHQKDEIEKKAEDMKSTFITEMISKLNVPMYKLILPLFNCDFKDLYPKVFYKFIKENQDDSELSFTNDIATESEFSLFRKNVWSYMMELRKFGNFTFYPNENMRSNYWAKLNSIDKFILERIK